MIYIVHLRLSYPAHPVSEQLTSRVHPPSSFALIVNRSKPLR
jgi:hypothetical protein